MLHQQLETFLQVAEKGSFSRAAAHLRCSSVSIMNQINNFEERLGIKLLARSSHGVELTEAGKGFYAEAKKLKTTADQILNNAREVSAGNLPVIKIGDSFLRPCKPLLDILHKCPSAWTGSFQIRIVPFSDEQQAFSRLRDRLGDGVDCFISPYDCADWINNYSIYHLGYYKCCISVPVGHPLAAKTRLALNDLAGETLMLVAPGISPILDQMRHELKKSRPDIILVDSASYYDVETFTMCQQKGYLMETPEIWAGIHPGIVTIPVDWPYQLPFGLIYSRKPQPIFENFIRMLSMDQRNSPL